MRSRRADRRGHWPRGRRRHADAGEWSRTRLALQRLLDAQEHRRIGCSRRGLAAATKVSDRSVRRWLAGEDRPSAQTQELVAAWVEDWRRRLAPRKR